MNLHAFYNEEHVGDILLIRLTDERESTSYETTGDITILFHGEDVIGYNLARASQYISQLKPGKIKITPTFVEELNKVLTQENQTNVISDYDDKFVVGKVLEMEDHPDSDHMHICQVDVGDEKLQIVCGAPNVDTNQLVVVAKNGAVMPSGLVIKPSSLRGVKSSGMLCSALELNLPHAPKIRGILVLDEEKYRVGNPFFE